MKIADFRLGGELAQRVIMEEAVSQAAGGSFSDTDHRLAFVAVITKSAFGR